MCCDVGVGKIGGSGAGDSGGEGNGITPISRCAAAVAVAIHLSLVIGLGVKVTEGVRLGGVVHRLPFIENTRNGGSDVDVVDIDVILIIRCSIHNGDIAITRIST